MSEHWRILLVDDDPRVLLIIRATLENLENSTELVTAGDGREALSKFNKAAFDLVISDVIMPGFSGVELVEAIRELDAETAIIWMTAYGCHDLQEAKERLNVYRCLEKPLRIKDIRKVALEALLSD
jgi:DNA-binding NtrC family response regulator